MLTNHKIAEEQITTFDQEVVFADHDLGNSKLGIGIIMFLAGFVGIWGSICMISGIMQANNLQQISRGFITAITGL
jgi:hypothetical protein